MGGDASGIRAGRAYVELYGNDDGLTDVLNRAEGMIGAWSARLKGAGVVATLSPSRVEGRGWPLIVPQPMEKFSVTLLVKVASNRPTT